VAKKERLNGLLLKMLEAQDVSEDKADLSHLLETLGKRHRKKPALF
jgi:hypothetical protein